VTRAPRPLIVIRRCTAAPALCVLCAVFARSPASALRQSGAPDSVVYRLLPASRLEVHTGKAGLFGFAGHEHVIRARGFAGRVVYFPAAPAATRVEITVPTDSLEVLTPPDTAEIRKVTEAMRTEVLQVERYRAITLVSKRIAPTAGGFSIDAELTMAGRTREVSVEARVEIGPDTLRAAASFAVKQTDFGIRPFRGGPAGTVRVADRVRFDIDAVAVR
jgi:polyisoprenoid-binding protein YceI